MRRYPQPFPISEALPGQAVDLAVRFLTGPICRRLDHGPVRMVGRLLDGRYQVVDLESNTLATVHGDTWCFMVRR